MDVTTANKLIAETLKDGKSHRFGLVSENGNVELYIDGKRVVTGSQK